jgi:hypothetical protein
MLFAEDVAATVDALRERIVTLEAENARLRAAASQTPPGLEP